MHSRVSIGWLGTALVFVAVAIRFGFPAKEQYAYYLAWGGLVCVLLYYARPVARDREGVLAAADALRHARGHQRPRRPRHPGRGQLHRHGAEQALGPDREQAVQPVGPDPQRADQARLAAAGAGVRAGAGVPALPGQAEGIRVRVEEGHRPSTSIPTRSRRSPSSRRSSSTARSSSTTRAAPSASRATPSRTSPTASSRWSAASSARSTSRRATASTTRSRPSATATTRIAGALGRENYTPREAGPRAAGRGARRRRGGGRRRTEDRLLRPPKSTR